MSEHEFERYLALLGGMLKLNPSQRSAIASELRDHLEERLQELRGQGLSRDQAIQAALEEFGDAAGLAAEFAQIIQQQRRRQVMRMTLGTVGISAAIILLGFAVWPQSERLPLTRALVAQDDGQGAGDGFAAMDPYARSKHTLDTEGRLQLRVPAEFLEVGLGELLEFVSESYDVQFYVNRRALEDLGVDTAQEVTIDLEEVPLNLMLELVLGQLDLTYTIRDGIVIVTTPEELESELEVRVYNCRDLVSSPRQSQELQLPDDGDFDSGVGGIGSLRMGSGELGVLGLGREGHAQLGLVGPGVGRVANSGDGHAEGFGGGDGFGGLSGFPSGDPLGPTVQLIELITSTAYPDSWDSVGGPGSISAFKGLLVINQDPHTHRRIERILHMMRKADQEGPGSSVRER